MEQVKDIMTRNPACCTPETSLQEAARLMVKNDCGEIPVVDQNNKPIGVITDRDICCRGVAEGKDPSATKVQECMSTPCVTVLETDSIDDCCAVLEENQIRRVPVVDENGACCGIVSQADLATKADGKKTNDVVRGVSHRTSRASQVM